MMGMFFLMMLAVVAFNFVIDPYNYHEAVALPLRKADIADTENHRLWKLVQYDRHPAANVIFGDSRGGRIDAAQVSERLGEPCFNLAYGGGSAYEMIDSFWHAAQKTQLRRVYFCIGLSMYNRVSSLDLVPEALNTLASPLHYDASAFVTRVSFDLCADAFGCKTYDDAKPKMGREAFWQQQLTTLDRYYGTYVYPQDLRDAFVAIRRYCDANGIEMSFIIPPVHADMQRRVADYGLTEADQRFKADLRSIAPVYDFDVINEITEDDDLFDDPWHGRREVFDWVVETVWGDGRS